MLIINLAIEIFCDGKDGYPCKGAHSYPFIAKRHLSQIQNYQVAINESLKQGWSTDDFQSHHCPECSSESKHPLTEDQDDLSKSKSLVN